MSCKNGILYGLQYDCKSLIGEACWIKMAGYWHPSFWGVLFGLYPLKVMPGQ